LTETGVSQVTEEGRPGSSEATSSNRSENHESGLDVVEEALLGLVAPRKVLSTAKSSAFIEQSFFKPT
jgi:hypothetical protein